MPRYWKKGGKRELRIVMRNDCYRMDDKYLYLPGRLRLRYKGKLIWYGKRGRLEIIHDYVDKVWRGFMTVKVEKPPRRGGDKPLYIDLGVINLATIWHRDMKQPIAFSGRNILSDWWYWTKKISREQSRLAKINNARASRKLRKLFRIRRRRFRHAVNSMVKWIMEYADNRGISKIILGDLKDIRNNNHKNSKANSMINNFWSFRWITQRFREKAEEYGIDIEEVNEYKTSSMCPRCRSDRVIKRGRLFKCLKCGLEANRDAIGVLNIALVHSGGGVNGAVTHPMLLRWNGCRWEPRRAMNTQRMKTLEARIPPLK
jgi:putative transposase